MKSHSSNPATEDRPSDGNFAAPVPDALTPAARAAVLAMLACPACWGKLRAGDAKDESAIVCGGCGLRFPVVDGIPVLIAERA